MIAPEHQNAASLQTLNYSSQRKQTEAGAASPPGKMRRLQKTPGVLMALLGETPGVLGGILRQLMTHGVRASLVKV